MTTFTLDDLGWSSRYQSQLADDTDVARVIRVHRDRVDALSPAGPLSLLAGADLSMADVAVGDWVTIEGAAIGTVLDRASLLARRAAGTDARRQVIGANIDTLGIVTSCNADFNLARLERYLVLATDAGCLPLILLTKADLSDDVATYVTEAERLSPLVTALALDAKDADDVARLAPWCRGGQTLALVGSSGVGKTTLRNQLIDPDEAAELTADIREDDAKGRHTTTARAMVATRFGGWLIDTPGMRALRLADVGDGIAQVFDDILSLADQCRFSDCAHETEPGCAVRAALERGDLTEDRIARWRKLDAEDRRNTETIAEARARDKGFGKMVRSVKARKKLDRNAR